MKKVAHDHYPLKGLDFRNHSTGSKAPIIAVENFAWFALLCDISVILCAK
jgi:hypothetical protein